MTPDDLSPTLGGGPVDWKFEERRQATTFRMPAEVERTREMMKVLSDSVAASRHAILNRDLLGMDEETYRRRIAEYERDTRRMLPRDGRAEEWMNR